MINKEKFKLVGHIDVDAGSIWVGDGCYVLKDKNEPRPKDFGENWHDICERYFTRSDYYASGKEYRDYEHESTDAWYNSTEFKDLMEIFKKCSPEEATNFFSSNPYADTMFSFIEKWKQEHPFTPKKKFTGVASFKHDGGHDGMGLMISTNYGDGTYPVYIEYDEYNRPKKVLIDFLADDEEE